jgi:hypothetical protein
MAGISSFRKLEYYFRGMNGIYVICYVNTINIIYLKNIPQYKYISARMLVYRQMANITFLPVYVIEAYGVVDVRVHSYLTSTLDRVVSGRIDFYRNVVGEE